MSIWRFADWLDFVPEAARVTLGEGNTPLVRSLRVGPAAGLKNLFYKLEFANPTGSYKDRFAAAAVGRMLAAGQTTCVATSSGNTGAALAAYCAAVRLECRVAIVETAPEGKLQQMLAYGAKLYRVRGFGYDAAVTAGTMDAVKAMGNRPGYASQVTAFAYSPLGMNGVKTIAHELAEQCGPPADHVFCPVGGGGLSVAVARGFADVVRAGRLAKSPRVELVQPEGNDTIVTALRTGTEPREVVCTSRISGLQVPNVIDGPVAVRECGATGGTGHSVSDDEVWSAQARMAREDGIFCEPAAAVALAGVLKAVARGEVRPDAVVVCLVTGSGFKDPPSVARMLEGVTVPTVTLDEFLKL